MKILRALLPWLAPAAVLALAPLGLSGGRAYAEDDKPKPAEPAMGEGAPAMGEGSEAAPDADEEEDEIEVSLNDKIKKAVEKGVAWLKSRQLPDGSWGPIEGDKMYAGQDPGGQPYKHPAGSAALALYTLLKCKVPVDDPVVKKGFGFLRSKHKIPQGAYELSMCLLAVTATADPFKKLKASEAQGDKIKFPSGDWREWAQKLHGALLEKRKKAKSNGWRYNIDSTEPSNQKNDLSSTQLAVLGLLAAERCGIKTESKIWADLIKFSMAQQDSDGPEWDRAVYDRAPKAEAGKPPSDADRERYGSPPGTPGKPVKDRSRGYAYIRAENVATLQPHEKHSTGGMTACGIGVIMTARYVLLKRNDEPWKALDAKAIQQSVYDGCAWLDANFSPFENPQGGSYHIYYLYCCERAFDLIGNRLVGKHPWYEEMARQLVGRQAEKGFWDSSSTHKPQEVLDTCFALLFLKRSTRGGIPYGSITGGGDEPPTDNRGR